MLQPRMTKGFTLIEIIIVVAIIGIMATISAQTFKNMYRESALRSAGGEVYGALTSARSETLASQNGDVYGVHVETASVTRFVGATYIPGDTTNREYLFEGGVTATSTLISNGIDIVFTRLTGEPNATGTIDMRNDTGTGTTTIVIHGSGLIEF